MSRINARQQAWAETEIDRAFDTRIEPWETPRGPHDDGAARKARYEVLRQPWRVLPDAPRCALDACASGRKACPSPLVCSGNAAMQTEAAHAASEYDDTEDDRPIPGAGPVGWLVLGVCGLLLALVTWHAAARLFGN